MGFLSVDEEPIAKRGVATRAKQPSLETLHRMQCQVCPLGANGSSPGWYSKLRHPHMQPFGGTHPMVYILGEAPGKVEDIRGQPFVGPAGEALRMRIPEWANDDSYLRWSNVVRTRPPDNRTPDSMEIECCRPSIVKDIEATKPFAIFGFGNEPLFWAIGERGITNWTGRHLPLKVGNHVCWYFPIMHPSAIIRGRKWTPTDASEFGSDAEFGFAKDVERAFNTVEDYYRDDYLPVVHSKQEALADIELVDGSRKGDIERVLSMLEHCRHAKNVGFDYETQDKRPYGKEAKLLSLGLSTNQRTMALALYHREAGWNKQDLVRLEEALDDFLYNSTCRKVVHSLAFEQEWTAYHFGTESLRAGKWGCTLMQAYTLDERQGALSLEHLCLQYFGLNIKAMFTFNKKAMGKEPLDKILPYQGVDARYHRLLYLEQHQRLVDAGSLDFYETLLRRVPTMVLTQIKGIPIHQPTVRKTYGEWLAKRTAVEAKLEELDVVRRFARRYNKKFRPSATQDVRQALEILGITELKSVDEDDLKEVQHPLADLILEWREAHKILSTYVLPVLDDPKVEGAGSALHPDGKMHPVTTLHKTRTSRSASEETNYQNWPKRDHKEIRSMVKVEAKWKLCSFDYGQIQARNVGMESLDKNLIKFMWDRYDIHHDWTERIAKAYPKWMHEKGGVEAVRASKGIPKEKGDDWWKWYRDRAKNLFVFPSFFGAQAPKLSTYLDIPQDVVAGLHGQFWKMFPNIKRWQERLIANYKRDGYTTSLAGHRRHYPITPNEIINAPIQADEAIIVMDAMARLSELGKWHFQANMEIHDDLTFIWPAARVEEYAIVVIDHMVKVPFDWANVVPIVVEFSIGDDWGIKTEVGTYASDTWKRSLEIDDAKRAKLGI